MNQVTSSNPPAGTENVLRVEHLTKIFRDFWHRPKVTAVQDISFTVKPGEVFGLLGPNGSGKSTTIKMILGLLHPTRGTIEVCGRPPQDVKTKQGIGYLPEESYLYDYLSSEETLNFYGDLFDLNRAECKKRIAELLEMVGLEHAGRRNVGEFSKGMARRIGLAQALINDPDLIILDEPTSGLDPIGTKQVKDLILALAAQGKTIILSSHLLADVEDVCDRIAILYNGRIRATGAIRDLLQVSSRYQVQLPELSPDQLKRVLDLLREALPEEPALEHPSRNLEQYFLEIIEKARSEGAKDSGAGRGRMMAPFLTTRPGAADRHA